MFKNIKKYLDRGDRVETNDFLFWKDDEDCYWFEDLYDKSQFYNSDWDELEEMLNRSIHATFVDSYEYIVKEELKNV